MLDAHLHALECSDKWDLVFIERSLEVKLPTVWTDGKAPQPARRSDMEKVSREKTREGHTCRCDQRGRKVAEHCVFPMICGSGGSKSRLAKAAGTEPAGHMKDEKLQAVLVRSTCGSKSDKNWGLRTTFGSSDVEKVHAVVARSAFGSKHANHFSSRAVLEVEMWKK